MWYFVGATFLLAGSTTLSTQWSAPAGLALAIPGIVVLIIGFTVLARERAKR